MSEARRFFFVKDIKFVEKEQTSKIQRIYIPCLLMFESFNPLKTGNPYTGTLAKNVDPDEMQHFIRICTVW